jgi:HK97 gp10 family phage protein
MPDRVTVEITGLDELQEKLNRLPVEFSRRAIRTSLRRGATVFRTAIEALAATGRYATGWMASQVFIRVKTTNLDEGSATVSFTHKQNPARVGNAQHTPGAIQEALWKELGTVKEPARPMIRPAFEASKGDALTTFADGLRDVLTEIVNE